MSKEYLELERLVDTLLVENKNNLEVSKANNYDCELLEERGKNLGRYKQALIKAQEQEKVLRIIKEIITKTEDRLQDILRCKDYEEYKELWYFEKELAEEEFDLLKKFFG